MAEQVSTLMYLQGTSVGGIGVGVTANGNGNQVDMSGINGAQQVEVQERAGGTATVTLQGSNDTDVWYNIGYYQVDGNATLTRSVSAVSVTANSAHVYQLLDPYPFIRAVISGIAGGGNIMVRVYSIPT